MVIINTDCDRYRFIARKPYKSKAPHALYLRDSACGRIQCPAVRAGTFDVGYSALS